MVSRIVNKIPKIKGETLNKSTATILYEQLLTAVDVKIVLLSGTPIITTRRRCPYYST
jgi:hypothetical protein